MKIIGSEEFFKQVGKIKKREMFCTYLYLIAAVGCIYKSIQHADICGRAGIFKDISELGTKEEDEIELEVEKN